MHITNTRFGAIYVASHNDPKEGFMYLLITVIAWLSEAISRIQPRVPSAKAGRVDPEATFS